MRWPWHGADTKDATYEDADDRALTYRAFNVGMASSSPSLARA